MSKIMYDPILEDNNGDYFRVNGAINENEEEACRIAMRHASVRCGSANIVRVDKIKIDN